MAYGFYYDLNLFSDFTYYLVDPYKGDQFEQQDRRWVAGFDMRHTIFSQWYGPQGGNHVRHAAPQRLDPQRPLPDGRSSANEQDLLHSQLSRRLRLQRRLLHPRSGCGFARGHGFEQIHGDDRKSLGGKQDPVGEQIPLDHGPARRLRQRRSSPALPTPPTPTIPSIPTLPTSIPIPTNRSPSSCPAPRQV